ncbi:MAG: TolC family protein, partial [Planctomycetes bacterium]|nr:TolC family protein [Planctomycetota bacterium]
MSVWSIHRPLPAHPLPYAIPSRASRALIAAALSVTLGGCVPYLGALEPRPVDLTMPPTFPGSDATAPAKSVALTSVRDFFQDEKLVALIEQALANNQELKMLATEIGIANSEVLEKRGEYLPKISAGASAGVEKVGRYTSQGASDENDPIEEGTTKVPENLGDFRAGFQATWEIDVWNRLRNATKAAWYRYLASIEGRNFAVTRLVAEVARSYYELMALDNQLEVLGLNIAIQNQALEIVRVQKRAAQVTELAVQRFEAEVLRNQGRLFDIRQSIVEAENRLNVLIGRFPQAIERNSKDFLQLPAPDATAGVPMQLLANRPDLRRAEHQLEAAKLDVSAAKARFYPSLGVD